MRGDRHFDFLSAPRGGKTGRMRMKLRILVASAAALVMAAPAVADIKGYKSTSGDNSVLFPTDMSLYHAGVIKGRALINDSGSGTPTLVLLRNTTAFVDTVGGTTTTNIPGTTVTIDVLTTAGPQRIQGGSGDTGSTINWGNLVGWTQSGRLVCNTHCPGGFGACGLASSCIPFVGFEGTGPPAPLKATTFNIDPMVFNNFDGALPNSGKRFTVPSVEFVNLSGGAVTANATGGGFLVHAIPALGPSGLAAMGGILAAMLFWFARRSRTGA